MLRLTPRTSRAAALRLSSRRLARSLATIDDASRAPIEDHDIVIVGGGPVGLALASALASSSSVTRTHKVSLLEGSDLIKLKGWSMPPELRSNRVSSITNENVAFLKRIGAWKHIDKSRINPMERMQVWDGLSSARITFDSQDTPAASPLASSSSSSLEDVVPHMGLFVENLHLQRALLSNLDAQGGVELIGGKKVARVEREVEGSGWPVVELEDGRRIRARLLIGADGFNSPVKKYSNISSTGWNYDAQCVVGNLEVEPSGFNFTAYQRFLTSGPLGFLPLKDDLASLAWSTKPPFATALKKLSSPALAAMVNAGFRLPHDSIAYLLSLLVSSSPPSSDELLSEIAWRSSPDVHHPSTHASEADVPPLVRAARMDTVASFPLKMFHADSYVGGEIEGGLPARTALIGDAAHVIHPMAGQGLNMGLGDARVLAKTLTQAVEDGLDVGSSTALAPYPRARYLPNHLVMSTVDKLHKLYGLDAGPIVWARSVGVEVLQELPALKSAMMGGAGSSEDGAAGFGEGKGVFGAAAGAYEAAGKARELAGMAASVGQGVLLSLASRYPKR